MNDRGADTPAKRRDCVCLLLGLPLAPARADRLKHLLRWGLVRQIRRRSGPERTMLTPRGRALAATALVEGLARVNRNKPPASGKKKGRTVRPGD